MKKFTHLFLLAACVTCGPANAQTIFTYAGDGVIGYSNGDGTCHSAEFNHPWGMAMDWAGNLYVADYVNCAIRKINASGGICTIAGNLSEGYSGDGGPATAAQLQRPASIAIDASGNIYIADGLDNRIRKVTTSGMIYTIAGTGATGYSGDGGPAAAATFNNPRGVATDALQNIYIADAGNNVIRKINTSGIITTIAGTGVEGYSGDGGPATAAKLSGPQGIAVDAANTVFIADNINHVVRKIVGSTITTFAGNGTAGFSGDGLPATSAQLDNPNSIAFDRIFGNVFISDESNNRIRRVDAYGVIHTFAGTGDPGYSGDGGPAEEAELYRPMGLALDTNNNVYVGDFINSVVRRIMVKQVAVANISQPQQRMKLYPNPAADKLEIELTGAANDKRLIEIQNMLGQSVYKTTAMSTKLAIDLSALPDGCYLVNEYAGALKVCSERLIKSKQ